MFEKIYKKNKIFAKVLSIGFVSTVSRTGINLAIGKILAVNLGPIGIAIYSQLINYFALLTTFSTGATTTGVVKLAAEKKGDEIYKERLISTVLKLNLAFSLLMFLSSLLFSHKIAIFIFNDMTFSTVIIIMGIALLFSGLNQICIALLNGLGYHRHYLYYQLITNFSLLILVVILVIYFSSKGALVAYMLTQVFAFVGMLYLLIKNGIIKIRYYLNKIFDLSILKSLSSFTLMSFSAVLLVNSSQIIIRNNVTTLVGKEEAGLWDAMLKVSNAYFMIIVSSLSIYYLPKVASLFKTKEIKAELFNIIKILLPLIIVGFSLIFLFRDIILKLLFSDDFLVLSQHFIPVLLGDLCKWFGWLFSYILIAKSVLSSYLINEVLAFCMLIGFTYWGCKTNELTGLFQGYFLTYFGYMISSLILLVIYLKKLDIASVPK